MNQQLQNVLGTLSVGSMAGTDATATVKLIPPYRGPAGSPPFLYKYTAAGGFFCGQAVTKLTTLAYTNGDTAHVLTVMRPKNRTYLNTAIAANATTFDPKHDPGLYSTSYNYPSNLTTGTAQVANNAIAASDWVAIQLKDGTFHVSKIASGTFGGGNLVLSTATPNVTGGGADAGAIVYWFGAPGDTDPATGDADINCSVAAVATSGVGFKVWDQPVFGFLSALNPGDPLLFYDPGTTHLGTLNYISGYFVKI